MKLQNKIDVHGHIMPFPDFTPPHGATGERFLSAEELIAMQDKLGIQKSVLLPMISPDASYFFSTSEACAATVQKYPERFAWFCNIDPRMTESYTDHDIYDLLAFYKSIGAKGLGELTANLYFDDPKMQVLLEACGELDMPVLIHISTAIGNSYGIVDDLGLPRIEKMLQKFPKLKVIGHSQAFWSEISGDNNEEIRAINSKKPVAPGGRITELMRKYPNLYCDLSANSGMVAMTRDEEHAAKFMTEFADRIYYGCDICAPGNTQSYHLNDLLDRLSDSGMISEETLRKICYENAEKLLK